MYGIACASLDIEYLSKEISLLAGEPQKILKKLSGKWFL
jgi:hypothetical protein